MCSFLALFAPSHVQNNPSAWLQPLIAAISETKTVFGARQSRRSVKEKGSNNTCVSVEGLVGVWNHIALTGTTLLFQGVPFVEKSDASKQVISGLHDGEQAGIMWALTGLLLLLKMDHFQAVFISYLFHVHKAK